MEGNSLVRRARAKLLGALAMANLGGVAIVLTCVVWVLPGGSVDNVGSVVALNAIVGGIYVVIVVPVGLLWGEGWLRSSRRWIQEERPPTDEELTAVLQAPMRLFFIQMTLWLFGAVLFSILNGLIEINLLGRIGFTIVLGGLVTATFSYLMAERITRPLAKAALSTRSVSKPQLPGITTRTMLGWSLGTGVPLTGIVLVAIFSLVDPADATKTQLSITMLTLGSAAIVVGWLIAVLGARAIAEPIGDLRAAIDRLGDGDLEARVEVSDGSVLGLLQSGFNDMARGIQEREQLRDLYGRQVGEDVAADALRRGTELGGEEREVAVMFVDVVGSTRLASTETPHRVVELLNQFFGVVVDVVHEQGGWINKFQGDATLVVFGAPSEVDHAPDQALATARVLAARLPREVPELQAGIGVAYGPAVAGNIGDERRFEYTVIGDPVNEAARLTELAKTRSPMLVVSADTVEAALPIEQEHWLVAGTVELRGRTRPTRLAVPTHP